MGGFHSPPKCYCMREVSPGSYCLACPFKEEKTPAQQRAKRDRARKAVKKSGYWKNGTFVETSGEVRTWVNPNVQSEGGSDGG